MFHNIPKEILDQMAALERVDIQDRIDGTPRLNRLRQIPPVTGKFLALLAAGAPAGQYLEIGTSAGYSALWLALACRATGRKLVTFEILKHKAALARRTFSLAGVDDVVELVEDDARNHIPCYTKIAFCFLDAEKEAYLDCYEAVVPGLVPGGLLVADNAINHRDTLADFLKRAASDSRVDSLIVPIGKGELLCRRL